MKTIEDLEQEEQKLYAISLNKEIYMNSTWEEGGGFSTYLERKKEYLAAWDEWREVYDKILKLEGTL